MLRRLFANENFLAVVVFVILLTLVIFLHGASPAFIYQGF